MQVQKGRKVRKGRKRQEKLGKGKVHTEKEKKEE